MNWKLIKSLYKMESERIESPILILIFAFLISLFLGLILFRPILIEGNYSREDIVKLQQFLMYMAMFFGTSFSLLFIEELKSDYNQGIFHTFLTYPVNPSTIVLSKLFALGGEVLYSIIITIFIFTVFSQIFAIWGILWVVSLFIGMLLLVYVTYTFSFIISPLINFSPLPEMLIITFYLSITFFSFSIPSEYLSLFAPFITVPKIIQGAATSNKDILFSAISVFMYLLLSYFVYEFMNHRKRRHVI